MKEYYNKTDEISNRQAFGLMLLLLVGFLLGFALTYGIMRDKPRRAYQQGYFNGVVDCQAGGVDMVIQANAESGEKDTLIWIKDTNATFNCGGIE